ncbi:uncharacterized LOC107264838 [Cephus cinctus]|uniref:Odorant receptor n=1 Tax=Cephus cinctus TaxID=211228 RepID=S5U409_CEPCN|nr:uncharacterized LOC107264838 [Cephus cinctus]AGS43064.1 odorant receptor Or3e [Cephus cinctus]
MEHKRGWAKIKSDIPNKNYDTDVEYAIKLNRWLLKPIGVWPLELSSSRTERIVTITTAVTCCLLMSFVLTIPCCIEMFSSQKDFKSRLEMLGPSSFCVMAVIKFFFFVIRGKEIRFCIDSVVTDWRNVDVPEERNIMLRKAKSARFLTTVCALFMYYGGIFYTTYLPLTTAKALSTENVTIRILPYRCNFILFDPYAPLFFDIIYFLQCLSAAFMFTLTSGVCSLAANFIIHACGQCQIIGLLLENLVDGRGNTSTTLEKRIAVVIVRHLHLLRFVTRVEDVLNEVCLVEFLGCTLNICLLGYYFITGLETADTARFVTFALLFISFTFNIFIFCYIGQLLTNHCHQIGEISYTIDWYRIPGAQARFLILLIAIANRPVTITAGKIVQLSFPCFRDVLKAALAYLNMLRKVTT